MQTLNSTNRSFDSTRRHMRLPDSLETRPETEQGGKSDAPTWLFPVFAFVAGFMVAMALFRPTFGPEYQRGHAEGFASGRKVHESELRATFESGVKAGRATP